MGNRPCGPVRHVKVNERRGGLVITWLHPEDKGAGKGRAVRYHVVIEEERLSKAAYSRAYRQAIAGVPYYAAVAFGLQDPAVVAAGGVAHVPGVVGAPANGIVPGNSIYAFCVAEATADEVVTAESLGHIAPVWEEQCSYMVKHVRGQQQFELVVEGLRHELNYRVSVAVETGMGVGDSVEYGPVSPHRTRLK